MITSYAGIELIKRHESLQLQAYRCPAGVWTIGYGHTRGVRRGDTCTPAEAEAFLKDDLRDAEAVVNRECSGLRQNQFDALVSFVFNVGSGAFVKSTLLKCVKANPDNLNIRYELSRWTKSKGMQLAGLLRRRREEADLYFS
ncbi:lysozyme [Massilibacteroides sp.]|uniref:lysozyme n=1 Tax=Massilibacteroides sp. TaxID=2034766 RepID=UPI002636A5A7|nr:lysozyme [Massilibacteroides sp.]MDD4516472.1 lysozyme [Massilibacteroides sp.]